MQGVSAHDMSGVFQLNVRPSRCVPARSHAATLPFSAPDRTVLPPGTTARFTPDGWPVKVWTIGPEATSHTRSAPSNEAPTMLAPSTVNPTEMIQARAGNTWRDRCVPVRRSSSVSVALGSDGSGLF